MDEAKLVKISQRPAKSCTECIRRKTRCSKVIPCEPCSKRGVTHLCRQESQFGPPIPTSSAEIDALKNALFGEINDLKRRISQLGKSEGKRRESPWSVNSEREEEGGAEAATTLEFMALGLDRRLEPHGRPKTADAGPTPPSSSSSSDNQIHITSGPSRSHLLKNPFPLFPKASSMPSSLKKLPCPSSNSTRPMSVGNMPVFTLENLKRKWKGFIN
ncbi:hypothetical protein I314_03609 [Cryptococcus bacillisporus CA1873]|uniref:Zn(2)-C6 fungal-type domain-containing protein n=1 Tax=Cryptococcus bacillisporus CA1873 TaxID=1296111 RepID=A0ABR5B9W4_CRYGA|nr:hypothetical protein I314_03609 [Cryptococcus bacillisporus CA1873]|eukprot:KIR60318.1 hypothetical protein I314_03609 [Cryptococcus gattii CA1873]